MADLFGRQAELQVGDLLVQGLRISFSVSRALRGVPGRAKISIWNLSDDSRGRIRAARTDDKIFVDLRAGYQTTGLGQIFRGRVRRVKDEVSGTDVVTILESGDGIKSLGQPGVSRAFGKGVGIADVWRQVVTDSGLGAGNALSSEILAVLGKTTVGGGPLVLDGSRSANLSAVLDAAGLVWSTQDEQIQVLGSDGSRRDLALLLNSDTGLRPGPTDDEEKGAKFVASLNPEIVPGRLVVLESAFLSGTYRVDSAEYVGDSEGRDWEVRCQGRRL